MGREPSATAATATRHGTVSGRRSSRETISFGLLKWRFRWRSLADRQMKTPYGASISSMAQRQIELQQSVWAYRAAQVQPMAQMRLSSRAIAVAVAGFGNLSEGSMTLRGRVANLSQGVFTGTTEVVVHDLAARNSTTFGPKNESFSLKPGEKKDFAANYDADRPLCGEAVLTIKDARGAALFDCRLPFVFSREVNLETRFIPTPAVLQLVLDLGSPASFKKAAGGRVKIVSLATKKEVLAKELPAFRSSLSISDVDCRQLPPGCYEATVELKTGAAPTVLKGSFVKEPRPEWLDNAIGISEKAPAPWTPLKTDGRKVACWGRQYTFGAAGFPSQINVLGQDILAGPVRILVRRANRTEQLPLGEHRTIEKKEARASFTSVSRACGVKIAADAWIEFDGFVWNTIKVQSDAAAEIDGLSIEIPLKKEYATLWWHSGVAARARQSDGCPPQKPYASDPLNFLRLGDEEHGIQFFFESVGHWKPLPGQGQEMIPGEREYVLRYNVLARPTKLEKPLEFALGYIALPCQPRSTTFRRINANNMWVGGRNWPSKEHLEKANWLFQTNIYSSGWQGRVDSNYFNIWNEEVFDKDFSQNCKRNVLSMWETNRCTQTLYYQACGNDANTPNIASIGTSGGACQATRLTRCRTRKPATRWSWDPFVNKAAPIAISRCGIWTRRRGSFPTTAASRSMDTKIAAYIPCA